MANVPMVSIGMPLYNCEKWLPPTMESILEQSERDFELIISDNASTDGTYELCGRLAAADSRIKLFRQETNLGAARNYRFVADCASAPFFKWASGSDVISPNYLAECLAVLKRHSDVVLCFGQTRLFTDNIDDSVLYGDDIDLQVEDPVDRFIHVVERLKLNNVLNGVIRRSALLRTSVMPPFLSSDNVVLSELALLGKFARAPGAVFYRRMLPETATKLKTSREVQRHMYPTDRIDMLMQSWQLHIGYSRAATRAALTSAQRTRLMMLVAKMWWWKLPMLWLDILAAGRYLLRRQA
jgi:glycosyltransferase involved in cell wall biosynthesis